MIWRILRVVSVIALLVLGTVNFSAYLGNAFAYSAWYGLPDKASLMAQALRNASLYFWAFAACELAAFAFTFSLVKWQDPDLSVPLRWLARGLVSVGIVVVSFVVNLEAVILYGRYARHH